MALGHYCPNRLFIVLIFSVLCLDPSVVESNGDDYYTSPIGIQRLSKVEQQLLSAFSEYATILENRVTKVKRYLEDYEKSVFGGLKDGSLSANTKLKVYNNEKDLQELGVKVSSHPLMTYRLIRRFVTDLHELEKDVGSNNEKKFLMAMEKMRKGIRLPRSQDVRGAVEGILRVQDAYSLDITEFTRGNFLGLETKSGLRAVDCYHIGLYALQAGIQTRAVEWIRRSYRMATEENDTSLDPEQAFKSLQEAVQAHDLAQKSNPNQIHVFSRQIGKINKNFTDDELDLEKLSDSRTYVLHKEQDTISDLYNFAALCSGKPLQPPNKTKDLFCTYRMYTKIPILREKLEFLNLDPPVVQVYDVISETQIDKILSRATPFMARSKVQGTAGEDPVQYSAIRTSTTTWIQEAEDPVLKTIPRRLQMITGLNIIPLHSAEDLQVSSYGIGGHYNPHFDNLFDPALVPFMSAAEIFRGERVATFMFYLSEVERGGGTAFPRLGVVAQPVKGSGIFWFNLRDDGSKDILSLHGGCPVIYGTKHVANKWIRVNAQFNTRKCEKKSD